MAGGGGVSGYGGAGARGSEEEVGEAYQTRRGLLMLEVVLAGKGAHGVDANRSPEFVGSSVALRRRRGRGFGACQRERSVWLDAQGRGEDACVKEKERGGRYQPGKCRRRGSRRRRCAVIVLADALGRARPS